MGGAPVFVSWKGQRVTPWMAYQLDCLDRDLQAAWGVELVCNSAIRLPQEQIDIFLERYVRAGDVKGRYVYDTRWWNGALWYRISAAGTVATPGTSNHEIQGSRAAVDIQDTGATAGIASRYSQRGQWLRQRCAVYDMVASGDGFEEGWHFDINNIFNTPPVPVVPTPSNTNKEDSMRVIAGPNGGQAYADEYGFDPITDYFFVPNGVDSQPTWVQNIIASWLLGGKPTGKVEDGGTTTDDGWIYELARHQADARWNVKRGEIVTDVVNSLSPLLQQIAKAVAGLEPEAVKAAIKEGLEGVVVKAQPISDADKDSIAEATRELFREDPLK